MRSQLQKRKFINEVDQVYVSNSQDQLFDCVFVEIPKSNELNLIKIYLDIMLTLVHINPTQINK